MSEEFYRKNETGVRNRCNALLYALCGARKCYCDNRECYHGLKHMNGPCLTNLKSADSQGVDYWMNLMVEMGDIYKLLSYPNSPIRNAVLAYYYYDGRDYQSMLYYAEKTVFSRLVVSNLEFNKISNKHDFVKTLCEDLEHPDAFYRIAKMHKDLGDEGSYITFLIGASNMGHKKAPMDLYHQYKKRGEMCGALKQLRKAVDAGNENAGTYAKNLMDQPCFMGTCSCSS